jgi:hypothetical protein
MFEYSIMHSGDMQDSRSLAHLVHNRHPHADLVYDSRSTNPRRDCSHLHKSRSRNRRT